MWDDINKQAYTEWTEEQRKMIVAREEAAKDGAYNEYMNMSCAKRLALLGDTTKTTDDVEKLRSDVRTRLVLPIGECKCTFNLLCRGHRGLLGGHHLNHEQHEQFKAVIEDEVPAQQRAIVGVTLLALQLNKQACHVLLDLPLTALVPVSVCLEQIAMELGQRALAGHAVAFEHRIETLFMWYPDKRGRHNYDFFIQRVFSEDQNALDLISHYQIAPNLNWKRAMLENAAQVIVNVYDESSKWMYIPILSVLKNQNVDFANKVGPMLGVWFIDCADEAILGTLVSIVGISRASYYDMVKLATERQVLHRVIKVFANTTLQRTYPHPLTVSICNTFYWMENACPYNSYSPKKTFEEYGRYWVDTANLCANIKTSNFTSGLEVCIPHLAIAADITGTEWPRSKLGEKPDIPVERMLEHLDGPWGDMLRNAAEWEDEHQKRKRRDILSSVSKKLRK